ncbi:MAG: polyprenyl synthetase family protein [Clostridia bacterium]|nr:polyprenyl synthetase family protein [Clostridia bacterium]
MKTYSLDEYVSVIEKKLEASVPRAPDGEKMREVMLYCLDGGGKRVRPMLCLEFCRLCGGEIEDALDFAAAVEFVHTYSLIHDDLPCMDDDVLRRGRETAHVRFGESTALLAGDAMLTHAFYLAAASRTVPPAVSAACVKVLADCAMGMVNGQVSDLELETRKATLDELYRTDRLKTGCLMEAACVMGVLASGNATAERLAAAKEYALAFGLAFQITDDVLDMDEETGEKSTYVSVLGQSGAGELASEYAGKALDALKTFGPDAEFLKNYTLRVLSR